MPRGLRLVLIARHDPPLALASLRAHGLLAEVRTNALRFTPAETAAFLRQSLALPVDEATIALLQENTEGWITGLQLAALQLRDQPDLDAARQRLQTSNPYLLDYLTGEVLAQEPPAVQEFLLKTSILERLCSPLCATLTGDPGEEHDYLQLLSENNLFLHEVDGEAGWRRYQRLFRQGLQQLLQRRFAPGDIALLHARASAWFAGAGRIEDALRHAVAAGEPQVAIQLLAPRRHDLMNREEWSTLQRWLGFFDRNTIEQDPDLSLAEAWLLLNQGRVQEYAPILAARWPAAGLGRSREGRRRNRVSRRNSASCVDAFARRS